MNNQLAFEIVETPSELEHRAELAERDRKIAELEREIDDLRAEIGLAEHMRELEQNPPQLNLNGAGNYETAKEIEIAVAQWFDTLRKIIVPNVYYGMFNYEMDLCVLEPSGYCHEVEIKVSKSDLIADKKKWHKHGDRRIRYLWFAIPEKLRDCIEHIPERAGVLVVSPIGSVSEARSPSPNQLAVKFDDRARAKLARLGVLRMWNLKRVVLYPDRKAVTE